MKDYWINIFYSAEDGGYIADAPDLEFCSAFGHTHEEALAEVQTALKTWIEVAIEDSKMVPKPRYRAALYQGVA